MKKRDSRFEIIRIISMMFIVMYHYTLYGNWTSNSLKIQFFRPWGQVGVALFVMITGYFLSLHTSHLRLAERRVIPLWIKTLFYSWIILIIASLFHFSSFQHRDYLFAIFPIIFDEYWFISSYIVLILLTPILNWMLSTFSKRNILTYIGIFIVVADIMPFIKNDGTPNAPLGNMFSVGAMLVPYLIAGYVHKYGIKIKVKLSILIILGGALLEYLSLIILKHSVMGLNIDSFTFGFLPLITAFGIFMFFLNLKEFHSKWVNRLASGVLASYLITEHPMFRMFFWHKLLNVGRFQEPTWMFIIMGIIIAVMTVVAYSILDHIYQLGYKKLVKKVKFIDML